MSGDRVVKRFPRADGGRAEREWRALNLLAAHAPGLAPEPREADLTATEPVVVMSRLPGVPLRPGRPSALIDQVDEWGRTVRPRAVGLVRQAVDAGLGRLAGSGLESGAPGEVRAVFGPGDGNLANYLWDGSRVRVVDF
jgi:hypothetical protein